MRFFQLMLCAVTMFLAQQANAQVVKSFKVIGNSRLDSQSVIQYLPFKVGDNPTLQQVDLGVKSLLAADLFSHVNVLPQQSGEYVIQVKENPIITKVSFEGNDRFDAKTLQQEVLLKEGAILTESRVKASMVRLQELYNRSGRYNAKIVPKIIRNPDNRVEFIFEVNEGDIVYIDDISFIGNRAFDDSELRKIIDSKEDKWWRIFSSTSTFDEDRMALDKSRLVEFYENKGFADFMIETATAELSDDKKSFIVKFIVNEGKRYEINTIKVDDSLTKIPQSEIADFITQEQGDYYSKKSIRKVEEKLVIFLAERGYPFVNVKGDIQRLPNSLLDLTYHIVQTPPAYVERINITGNVRTMDEIIRRKLSIVEGDPLNRSMLQKSERDLRGTGYFSKVDFVERSGSVPGAVDMNVNVEEQSTGDVTFGVGYSTIDDVLGEVSLSERNFLGRGQYVRAGAVMSGRRQQVDLGFTEPYMFGRDLQGGFDLYHTTNDYAQEASFSEKNTGLVLRSGFQVIEDLSLRPRYKINQDDLTNLRDDVSPIVRDSASRGALISSSVGYEAVYDKRDDFIIPTEGYVLRLNQDVAGVGGDVNAVKTIASGKYYYTPVEQYVFSQELEGGIVNSYGGYDLRIIDRNLLGGNSFRGFEVAGVGPRFMPTANNLNDDSLGGTYFAVVRSELMIPIPGLDDFGMAGAIFNDTGTLWNVDNVPNLGTDGTIEDDQALRSSAGVGILWKSPMGPIRLDFTHAFMKEDYDRTEVFRFSAGSSF